MSHSLCSAPGLLRKPAVESILIIAFFDIEVLSVFVTFPVKRGITIANAPEPNSVLGRLRLLKHLQNIR